MEDWFFDKQRGEMDVRIIAIAPVVYDTEIDNEGNEQITGKKELFWLYFPHCRYVFNNYFSYNGHNDSQCTSFDDLFWSRRFSSYIYKDILMEKTRIIKAKAKREIIVKTLSPKIKKTSSQKKINSLMQMIRKKRATQKRMKRKSKKNKKHSNKRIRTVKNQKKNNNR